MASNNPYMYGVDQPYDPAADPGGQRTTYLQQSATRFVGPDPGLTPAPAPAGAAAAALPELPSVVNLDKVVGRAQGGARAPTGGDANTLQNPSLFGPSPAGALEAKRNMASQRIGLR